MTDTRPTWTWRMLVRGTFTEAWVAATPALREAIFDAWIAQHERWQRAGCTLVVTIDDLEHVANPGIGEWNFYSVWEIPTPVLIYDLLSPFWDEEGTEELRLSEYFSLSVVLGKPIISMERRLGGVHAATPAAG